MPRNLKRQKGRLKELEHLDIVEVKWVDAASDVRWASNGYFCGTLMCMSLGYFDGIHKESDNRTTIHIYGDRCLENDTLARRHGIPIENIREFRVVSKGKRTSGN